MNYEVNAGIKILFSRQDLNKITELLDSHNWKTRLEAAKALREFGPSGKDAVSKLIKTLSEEENSYEGNKVRNYVIDALGAIKDQSAIPALLNEVNSELSTKDNMWLAVKQLGNFGENARKAIPVLIRTLNNENSSIRSIAAEMLGMVGKGSSKVASNLLRSGFITSSV